MEFCDLADDVILIMLSFCGGLDRAAFYRTCQRFWALRTQVKPPLRVRDELCDLFYGMGLHQLAYIPTSCGENIFGFDEGDVPGYDCDESLNYLASNALLIARTTSYSCGLTRTDTGSCSTRIYLANTRDVIEKAVDTYVSVVNFRQQCWIEYNRAILSRIYDADVQDGWEPDVTFDEYFEKYSIDFYKRDVLKQISEWTVAFDILNHYFKTKDCTCTEAMSRVLASYYNDRQVSYIGETVSD